MLVQTFVTEFDARPTPCQSKPSTTASDAHLGSAILPSEKIIRPIATCDILHTRQSLTRLRRISMPVTYENSVRRQPNPMTMASKRSSLASSWTDESVPEEQTVSDDVDPSSERMELPLPRPQRRIRVKSDAIRKTSTKFVVTKDLPSSQRRVSMALLATTPMLATTSSSSSSDLPLPLPLPNSRLLACSAPVSGLGKSPLSALRLDSPTSTRSIISPAAYHTAKRTVRSAKKDRIANELLETERVYVGILEQVQEVRVCVTFLLIIYADFCSSIFSRHFKSLHARQIQSSCPYCLSKPSKRSSPILRIFMSWRRRYSGGWKKELPLLRLPCLLPYKTLGGIWVPYPLSRSLAQNEVIYRFLVRLGIYWLPSFPF